MILIFRHFMNALKDAITLKVIFTDHIMPFNYNLGFPVAQLVKNPPTMLRHEFYPWVGKIPWRREQLPSPVFWPGEFHGLYSSWDHKKSDTTE